MYKPEDEEQEINLLEYWQLLLKRKWVVIACVGAALFFTGVYVFRATPQYKSTGTMMIEDSSSRMLSIEDEFGSSMTNRWADLRSFNTQIRLLSSKALMERVARKLDLANHSLYAEKDKKNNGNGDEEIPVDPYPRMADDLKNALEVSPVRDTKLVQVSFTSPDPEFAAEMVNTVAREFVDFYVEKRYQTTQRAVQFLEEQILQLRDRLSAKEGELQKYGRDKDIFFLNDNDSAAVKEFADINQAYTQAKIERINAQARYEELKNVRLDALPQFTANPVLQRMRTDYVQIKNEYEEKRKLFKPDYPELITLRGRLDSMQSELQNEITSAQDAAETDYRTSLNKEQSLNQLLDKQKTDVTRMNSDGIQYNNLLIEVKNMRDLLTNLESRQNDAMVSSRLGDLETTNISVIETAEVPRNPVSPKKKLSLILALLVGLFGGVGLAFVLEYLDNTVNSPEEAEKLTGVPSLGMVPYLPPEGLKKSRGKGYSYRSGYTGRDENGHAADFSDIKILELVNHLYPNVSIAEDYRTIRTSIMLSSAETPPRSIAFTSALPGEGKSVTAANMAVAFAQLNEKVLIVDADMRKPVQHRIFGIKTSMGLSTYLTGKADLKDCIHATKVKGISLIPCGPIPPNPSELLNSKPMRKLMSEVKDDYDKIFFDLPPVLAVVDPVVVSNLVEATVFVVYPKKTTDKGFVGAVDELKKSRGHIIGTIFNGVRLEKGDYYYKTYYKAYYRSRGYGEQDETAASEQK